MPDLLLFSETGSSAIHLLLILGVGLSLVLGGIVVGVFLYGRRKEIKGEE